MEEKCETKYNYNSFNEELNCMVINETSDFIERDGKQLTASKIKLDIEMIGSINNRQLNELRLFVLEVVDSMNNSTFESAQINYKKN